MEEEHRLEGCMRSNVAGSAVVICSSQSISQIVGYHNGNREMEVWKKMKWFAIAPKNRITGLKFMCY